MSRTPSPTMALSIFPSTSSTSHQPPPPPPPSTPSPQRSTKTSVASSTRSEYDATTGMHSEKQSSSGGVGTSLARGIGRFFRGSSSKQDSIESARSDDGGGSRPSSPTPNPSRPKSPTRSRSKRLAGFASRSIRKSQWRLFKHRTFFGSQQRNSMKKNELQLPKLTLRHPSVDSAAMPLPIDVEDGATSNFDNDFLQIRRTNQRRWTDSDTSGRLRDSRDSSDFHDSHDTLDVGGSGGGSSGGGSTAGAHHLVGAGDNQSMTAPVSPNVPLSASSSHSEGWKFSSQKLLYRLRTRNANLSSRASSASSSTDSAWKSQDSMTWRSCDGVEITLRGTRLESLSEIERGALQSVAVQQLVKLMPTVNFGKPKDALSVLRQKRQKLVKTNRAPTVAEVQRRASSTQMADEKRVFGVSLAMCMLNEKRLDQESRCRSLDDSTVCMINGARGKQVAKPVKSEPEMMMQPTQDDRKWLYPSTHNLYPSSSSNPTSPSPLLGSAPPTCSIMTSSNHLLSAEPDVNPTQIQGRFAKKSRPSSASFSCSLDVTSTNEDVDPHALQVPRIVENCTQYLMTYGLNQVGLFRVAGNTKRCRQLRNALEKAGGGTAINDNMVENTTPHDVATLLKEYFRDLPQSLLPREHYQAYIAAAMLGIEERLESIRLLFALLVSPNLDTLFVLLKFLHEVSLHSIDKRTPTGEIIQGNKMDARNLATIFAPSILRADHENLEDTLAESEQQITVVETMITNVEEIFKIPKELQSKIYSHLRETEPDRLDRILNHMCKIDSHDHGLLLSPFPATLEEDSASGVTPATAVAPLFSPRIHHRHSDHSHIGRQSPLAMESKVSSPSMMPSSSSGKRLKVQSQRSGSWPFSLQKSETSPRDTATSSSTCRFFAEDEDDDDVDNAPTTSSASATQPPPQPQQPQQYSKSATTTPSAFRKSTQDSGRESEFCSQEAIEMIRARAETVTIVATKKVPMIAKLAGTSKSVDARSPSRERVDTLRTAARSGAQAARRRLRNVVRAFRFTSTHHHHRSSPDIPQLSSSS